MSDTLDHKNAGLTESARDETLKNPPDKLPDVEKLPESQVPDAEFTKGDWFLCAFTGILIGGLFLFFWYSQSRQEGLFLESFNSNSSLKSVIQIDPADNEVKTAVKLNALQSDKQIEYLTKAILSSSARKNAGFLVGTLLALMGCIIIFRRIRQMPATIDIGALKTNLVSSSPGIIIVVLGSLIILATIYDADIIDFKDEGLNLQSIPVSSPSPTPSTPTPSNPTSSSDEIKNFGENMNKQLENIKKQIGGNINAGNTTRN
jgi:hypothetical protein